MTTDHSYGSCRPWLAPNSHLPQLFTHRSGTPRTHASFVRWSTATIARSVGGSLTVSIGGWPRMLCWLRPLSCCGVDARQPSSHPASAVWQDGFYQEMSLNNPGTGGFCGGVYAGDSRFSAGGLFANGQVVKTYTAGETIPIKVCLLCCCCVRTAMSLQDSRCSRVCILGDS